MSRRKMNARRRSAQRFNADYRRLVVKVAAVFMQLAALYQEHAS